MKINKIDIIIIRAGFNPITVDNVRPLVSTGIGGNLR